MEQETRRCGRRELGEENALRLTFGTGEGRNDSRLCSDIEQDGCFKPRDLF